jgi:antirestriction protein ArdC
MRTPSTEQQSALERPVPRVRVVRAAPGSGKTWLVAEVIRQEITSWQTMTGGIAALSFTRVGGEEIRSAVGYELVHPHFVGTIDAFLFRYVVRPFFALCTPGFRRYSWNNVLLISSQRPDATHVAGLHTWNDLGRTVKKGEKGVMILAPVMVKREESRDQTQAKERSTKEPLRVAGFRTAYVFDVAQTEGKALPEFAKTTGDPKDYTDKLKAFAAGRGIAVEYDSSISPAMGLSSGGRIRLKPDLAKGEEFAVLVHELAHEMLHHREDLGRPPEVVRETQAEAVAYVVSQGVGLETNTAAVDYIALYNGDKKTLAESLSVIQETSAKILDELLPDERRMPSALHSEPAKQAAEPPEPAPQEPVSWDR